MKCEKCGDEMILRDPWYSGWVCRECFYATLKNWKTWAWILLAIGFAAYCFWGPGEF